MAIWLNKEVEYASHCVPLLASAAGFAGVDVTALIKKYWLSDPAYDALTLRVLLELKDWNSDSVLLKKKLVKRSDLWTAGMVIEKIAEIDPELAPRILRARLGGKLSRAIQEIEVKNETAAESQEDEQYSMS
ncbi:MAG: hypothetical protein M0T74_03295, partial [Desulfitobacterium hafniense]|nr:hypothetical protein [Desulfitobacterium hafniense]